jgi:hypothetical protein
MTTSAVISLRRVLFVDAATCVASGLLMGAGARPLSDALQLPQPLLLEAGLLLFPIAAFIAFVAARASTSLLAVAMVVIGNLAWAAASVWVLASASFSPNRWGTAFVVLQAITVLVLSALEARGALALRSQPARDPLHA